jgi:DNA-binding HxlR family transcriptional regulator
MQNNKITIITQRYAVLCLVNLSNLHTLKRTTRLRSKLHEFDKFSGIFLSRTLNTMESDSCQGKCSLRSSSHKLPVMLSSSSVDL